MKQSWKVSYIKVISFLFFFFFLFKSMENRQRERDIILRAREEFKISARSNVRETCATLTTRYRCTVFCKHWIDATRNATERRVFFPGVVRVNQLDDEIRTHAYRRENFFARSRRSWHRIRILVRYQWWWVKRLNWRDRLYSCTRCPHLNNRLLSVTTDHHQPFCLYERITLLEKKLL